MPDNNTVTLVVAGGAVTAVSSLITAMVGKHIGKKQTEASIAETITKASEAVVKLMKGSMDTLYADVKSLDAKHKSCETGRKRDRAECERNRRRDKALAAKELAELRIELKQHLPDIMAEPIPAYTDLDIRRGERARRSRNATAAKSTRAKAG